MLSNSMNETCVEDLEAAPVAAMEEQVIAFACAGTLGTMGCAGGCIGTFGTFGCAG